MKSDFQRNILFILIPSTILIVAWIIFGIYNKSVSSTITASQTKLITPISPTFNVSVFDLLRRRKVIKPLLRGDESPLVTSPTPSASQAGSTSPTPALQVSPTASQEGGIQ